jgi:hypothetical protein
MEQVFEINVDDLIFDGIIEKDEDTINIFIGNTKMRMKSCIWIEVDTYDKYAILHNLEYSSKCELNNKLAKAALKFVFDNYDFLNYISIFDKAKKNDINITPKRLLLGKEGWYAQHFNAKPNLKDDKTKSVMKFINKVKLTDNDKKIMEKREWGTDEDISNICIKLKLPLVIGTSWNIDRDSIINYDINYEIKNIQKGGKIKEKLKKIINKAECSNYSWQKL